MPCDGILLLINQTCKIFFRREMCIGRRWDVVKEFTIFFLCKNFDSTPCGGSRVKFERVYFRFQFLKNTAFIHSYC